MNRYLKALFIFAALELFSVSFLVSQPQDKAPRGAQTLIPPRHWIYDSLQILEQESGIVQFSDQAPLAIQQIRAMLLEIDYDVLSANAKAHYDNIIAYFNETQFSAQASIMQARIEPAVNLEGYVKTNDDVSWIYNRFEKQKLIELPITIGVGDFATLYSGLAIGINKTYMEKNGIYCNVLYNDYGSDVNFPHNSYLSLGTMLSDEVGFNFRISNLPQSFGRAQTGSIIQSEYLQDTTDASITFFSPMVQFSSSITELNLNRYMYSHKLDVRFGKKFQFSAMEGCLPFAVIDLKYFNPMMIFHNYTSWYDYEAYGTDVGSYLGVKINYAPVKNLRLYAAATMTQFQLPGELSDNDERDDNYVPNALGWQAGAESYIPLGEGHLHFVLDGYYAQPYLYINANPNWSFVKTGADTNPDSLNIYEWVGTKYGPDTAALTFAAEYQVPQKWSAGFKYIFLARGELSDPEIFKRIGWGPRYTELDDAKLISNWVYPRAGMDSDNKYKKGRSWTAPSGTPEFANVFTLRGTYQLNEWLDFVLQPSLAVVLNSGHKSGNTDVSFECALSARCKLYKISKGN